LRLPGLGRFAGMYQLWQLLHVSQQKISIFDLIVQVAQCPVQRNGEQVFEDVLCDLLGGSPEPFLLYKAFFSLVEKTGPVLVNALRTAAVRGQILYRFAHDRLCEG